MLFPYEIIETITDCVEWADRLTRADLAAGIVVTENDYTSNFTAALRREIAARNIHNLKAKIQVLNSSIERKSGTDGCIILSNETEFKVGIFEAKWPRLLKNKDSWDSLQRSSGISHFDEQLKRQESLAGKFAIWEMFYSEYEFGKQPSFMPDTGSACVWHEHAFNASQKREIKNKPWTDNELEALLTSHSITTSSIVREICECKHGTAMPEQNYANIFENFEAPDKALVITYPKRGRRRT